MPIITPEETNAIEPTSNTEPYTVQRLCEYDEGGASGCRRTENILALEKEFDTVVSPEMQWGMYDEYCIHKGKYYYQKSYLDNLVAGLGGGVEDEDEEEVRPLLSKIEMFTGLADWLNSRVDYRELIRMGISGVPKFIEETENFIVLESVGGNEQEIDIDDMTREILDIIQESFSNDINPLLSNLAEGLIIKDGKAYHSGILGWRNNPFAKLGVFMNNGHSSKVYDTDGSVAFFFPFSPLTSEQKDFVETYYIAEAHGAFTKELKIVDL